MRILKKASRLSRPADRQGTAFGVAGDGSCAIFSQHPNCDWAKTLTREDLSTHFTCPRSATGGHIYRALL